MIIGSSSIKTMKKLIVLNVVTGVLLSLVTIAFRKYEGGFLLFASMALLLVFGVLAIGNVVSIFTLRKKHRFWTFLPSATYALAVAIWFWGAPYGARVVLEGTPCYPDSFLVEKTKSELEDIATSLLGRSFKEICTYPSQPTEVEMISGHAKASLPSAIQEQLRAFGFQRTYVDDAQSLVVFSHCRTRIWYDYIFTKNPLLPLYSRPALFTEVDIENWAELLCIVRQGQYATDRQRRRIVFEPTIIYPFLEQQLGREVIEQLKTYRSDSEIQAGQKCLVLAALNRQRLADSRLVEYFVNPLGISDGFWVAQLLKKLLDDGVLVFDGDQRHLKLKKDLSEEERCKVEWLHVGLMNFLYGNLLEKREHDYERQLGEKWYFNRS